MNRKESQMGAIGIHNKFNVRRTDGSSSPGRKHEKCAYFVLDLEHDPYAIPALKAYAEACKDKLPDLARDLCKIIMAERGAGFLSPSETADLLMLEQLEAQS